MKLTKYILPLFATVLLTGCDNISLDDRYIELPKVEVNRTVLITEYTGQLCSNCPDGHKYMQTFVEQYGDNIIPVGIYPDKSTSLAIPQSSGGIGNEESDEYYKQAGTPNLPAAQVNFNGKVMTNRDEWAQALREAFEQKSELDMSVEATAADGNLAINVVLEPKAYTEGQLVVWVLESGIVALQLNNGTPITDYVHNHVFRHAVNGLNGQAVKLERDTKENVSLTQAIDSKWKVENLSVVAFVRDGSGVLQAAHAKVK